jgi:hypothetical protein
MIQKMAQRRKFKHQNEELSKREYRRLNNELGEKQPRRERK